MQQALQRSCPVIRLADPFACPSCGETVLIPRNKKWQRKYCTRSCATASYNRKNFVGANNPRWRGGKVLSYGPGWKAIKKRIRERDRVCRQCGKTPEQNGRALDVHHLEPYRFSGDHSPENLVALCRSCHMRADDHGRRGSARFAGSRMRLPSRTQVRKLEQEARGARVRQQRAAAKQRAFSLAASGASLRGVAAELGVSHQTVANWLNGVHEPPAPYDVHAHRVA